MMAAPIASGIPEALSGRLAGLARRLHGLPAAARWGVSVDGRSFAGPAGPLDVPERVSRRAAGALAAGSVETVRGAERIWLVTGADRPLPARVALAAPAGARPAPLRPLVEEIAARVARELLPDLLTAHPWLAVVASAPALGPIVATLRRAAPTPLPLLLLGETGTGKEVLARAVHAASGRAGAFVAENCAALPEPLLEAELFGSRRGAFTGALRDRPGRVVQAERGTLFLDEVGEMPPLLQAKLLRLLQDGEIRALGSDRPSRVDVRFVAATHRDLPELVARGRFRADLYYRLAGLVVRLPPLTTRRGDLPYLAATLLARAAREGIGPGRHLSPAALERLERLPLRGNVRELDNLLRRAAVLATGPLIGEPVLRLASDDTGGCGVNLERAMIEQALAGASGVKAGAARRLGWTRQKLYRRMRALGLG